MKSVPETTTEPIGTYESSEVRLLRAVLKLAVLDSLSNGKGVAAISSNPKLDKLRADRWLFSEPVAPNSPPFSFGWICQHLSEDYIGLAQRIRDAVKTLKAQQKTLSSLQKQSNQDEIKLEAA